MRWRSIPLSPTNCRRNASTRRNPPAPRTYEPCGKGSSGSRMATGPQSWGTPVSFSERCGGFSSASRLIRVPVRLTGSSTSAACPAPGRTWARVPGAAVRGRRRASGRTEADRMSSSVAGPGSMARSPRAACHGVRRPVGPGLLPCGTRPEPIRPGTTAAREGAAGASPPLLHGGVRPFLPPPVAERHRGSGAGPPGCGEKGGGALVPSARVGRAQFASRGGDPGRRRTEPPRPCRPEGEGTGRGGCGRRHRGSRGAGSPGLGEGRVSRPSSPSRSPWRGPRAAGRTCHTTGSARDCGR